MSETNGQAMPLAIRLFGSLEVVVDGAPLPRLRSRQGWWLLALLTLRQERDVSRAWLQETLWPDSQPQQAAYNLRRNLSDLRGALGKQAVRIVSPTPQTLRLDLNGADVDILAFDRLRQQGDTVSLEQATQRYHAPLLVECSEEWVLAERAFRQEAYLTTLKTLAERAEERGEPAAAIPYLERLIAADALRESAHRQLMRILAQTGAYGAAVKVFYDLRRLLREQFPPPLPPVQPDAETILCYREIRREARRKATLADSDVKPVVPAAPAAAPPPPRHNLPRARTTFIGREKESAEAGERLRQSVLLTLTGPGGAGKTRLAQQVALVHLDACPDGVWLVELAALSEPSLVPQTIAAAVGATEPDGSAPTLATLLRFLPSRDLLLVLDNCEHLIEVCADVADALLSACPHLRILATSRQALGVTGEWLYPVPPLALPDSNGETLPASMSESMHSSEAVRLFVERARLVAPDFALTPHNAAPVAQICRHLDGIPLAIELAAARIRALAPEQIAARMDDRFALLTGGSRTAAPRQRTLQAAMDWSYDLLTARERMIFERVSVFAGGFTLEAAESVCLTPLALASRRASIDMLDTLTQLLDKSLLLHPSTQAEGEPDRFDLLETLRQYGQERLQASGDEAETRTRHRDFCLMLAEQAQSEGQGMAQVAWHDRLEREGDNLRTALTWSLQTVREEGEKRRREEEKRREEEEEEEAIQNPERLADQEKMLRLVNALYPFWNARGYFREGRKWLSDALECCPEAAPELRATALRAAGDLARLQGDHAQASVWYEQSLTLARDLGDWSGVAGSLNGLGIMAHFRGDYAQAQTLCEESLHIRRDLGDKRGIAISAEHLAIVMYFRGEHTQSAALYRESLDLKRELGDRKGVAWALGALGSVVCLRGDYAQGAALYAEALATQRELGDRRGIVYSLEGLAGIILAQGNAHKGVRLWGAADALRAEAGLPPAPDGQERSAQRIAQARAALGEDAFAAAWNVGRALTYEQASAYALNEIAGIMPFPSPLLLFP